MNNVARLTVKMKSDAIGSWNLLLQKGFYKTGPAGLTVREFLMTVLGYDSDFIDESVRTIFLNYSPVDDIDDTRVKDGDKLSLGSAMPGLVGIVMGRDNPFKSFREDITCHESGADEEDVKDVRVFMKIFSTLAVGTGTDVLACGIETTAGEVRQIIEQQKAHLHSIDGLDGLENEALVEVSVDFSE